MAVDLSIDPSTPDLIPGRAGRGRGTYKPMLITIHIQEGTNYLPAYFKGVQADSTMWCNVDGKLTRMLYDTDDAWTNGDWTEPINHANPLIQQAYTLTTQNGDNSNVVALTVECAGFHTADITPAQYAALAKLCAYWCNKYGWVPTRQRIIGHYEVGEHKQCPGMINLDRVVALTQGLMQNSGVDKLPDNFPKIFNPNPKGFSVGDGMLARANQEHCTFITNEQFFLPDGYQPGLGKMSRAWVQDAAGVTYIYMASELIEQAKVGQATPWKVERYQLK